MKLLFVDCDSTLSAVEGIDELARLRGPEVFQAVEEATTQAMNGTIPINEVFGHRLQLIRPTEEECARIGQLYIDQAAPGVREALQGARDAGWHIIILSGGFVPCIRPLADWLGGIEEIEAVPLYFDAQGQYAGYGSDYPTTRNGGKPEIIQGVRKRLAGSAPSTTVMVGDGISDWETTPVVDLFVGYGGVVARPKVEAKSPVFIRHWSELAAVLAKL